MEKFAKKVVAVVLLAAMLITSSSTLYGCSIQPGGSDYDKEKGKKVVMPNENNNEDVLPKSDSGRLLEFSYSFGSFHGGELSYRIFEEDGKVYFTGWGANGISLDARGEVPGETLSDIQRIIEENNIERWDGFDEADWDIHDGYSFLLTAEYEDRTLSAKGYMRYPSGYETGHLALAGYLTNLVDTIHMYTPSENDTVLSLQIIYGDRTSVRDTSFSLYYDRGNATYRHGDTTIRTTFEELPAGTVAPQELSEMVVNYCRLNQVIINDIYEDLYYDLNEMESYILLELKMHDGVLIHTVYALGDNDDLEFNIINDILLSYFDVDASVIR